MMHWYSHDINGWGYALMTISMLAFWGLVIFGVILLVRRPNDSTPSDRRQTTAGTPEQQLAGRYARGEIDQREFTNRLDALRGQVPS